MVYLYPSCLLSLVTVNNLHLTAVAAIKTYSYFDKGVLLVCVIKSLFVKNVNASKR